MKYRLNSVAILAAFIAGTLVSSAHPQTGNARILEIDYMKVRGRLKSRPPSGSGSLRRHCRTYYQRVTAVWATRLPT